MAVLVIGYPPGPAPPMQVNNELVNLQARWDANWYLGIVTEGYHFVPNQPGLQQSIAFFPAYPMLVRGVGRILGRTADELHRRGHARCRSPRFLARWCTSTRSLATRSTKTKRASRCGRSRRTRSRCFSAPFTSRPLMLLGMTGDVLPLHPRARSDSAALWGLLVGLTKTNGFLLSIPLAMLAISGPGSGGSAEQSARAGRLVRMSHAGTS